MGHVKSITRSLGQMLENPCVHCRGHISRLLLMELGQNLCLMPNCSVQGLSRKEEKKKFVSFLSSRPKSNVQ